MLADLLCAVRYAGRRQTQNTKEPLAPRLRSLRHGLFCGRPGTHDVMLERISIPPVPTVPALSLSAAHLGLRSCLPRDLGLRLQQRQHPLFRHADSSLSTADRLPPCPLADLHHRLLIHRPLRPARVVGRVTFTPCGWDVKGKSSPAMPRRGRDSFTCSAKASRRAF